jgi:hypothetical protein
LEFDVDSIDASDLELVLVTADGEISPLAWCDWFHPLNRGLVEWQRRPHAARGPALNDSSFDLSNGQLACRRQA